MKIRVNLTIGGDVIKGDAAAVARFKRIKRRVKTMGADELAVLLLHAVERDLDGTRIGFRA
jgi:hypothetical protein